MKAAVVSVAGGPEVLEIREVPTPVPQPGSILIKVKAFGLNRGELLTRQGHSPSVRFPRILGIECVGIVAAAPGGELAEGTKVAAVVGGMGRAYDGSYAEYACVPAASVFPLETDLDWVQLAAIPEMFLTAWGALTDSMQAAAGQTLLIRGGTSSVGLAAASLAAGWGLHVITTTRRPERRQALLRNGAHEVLIDDGRLAPMLRALVPDGVQQVLELVGTVTLLDSLRCAAQGGVVCMAGLLANEWTLTGFAPMEAIPSTVKLTAFSSSSVVRDRGARLQQLVEGVAAGRYRPLIDGAFPFAEIAEAHRRMEGNAAVGKIVVTVDA